MENGLNLTNEAGAATDKERKAIVIGEGMERVKAGAKELREQGIDAKWYQALSRNFPDRLMTESELNAAKARNTNWLMSKIKQGYKLYDVGIDPSRQRRSPFYELEKDILKQLNYPITNLP